MVTDRRAARALLIAGRSVLLIKGHDPGRPERGSFWWTPGGGIEAGESIEAAVAREVLEETGLDLAPERFGPVIATRVATFDFESHSYRQREWFFAVELAEFTPDDAGWDDSERRALIDQKWWTVEELRATDEVFYPSELADVVDAVLAGAIDQPLALTDD